MIIYHSIINGNFRIINILHRKKLKYGNLLCISSDKFNNLFWATVSDRGDDDSLLKHKPRPRIYIKIISNNNFEINGLKKGIKYDMVESPEIFFESYVY